MTKPYMKRQLISFITLCFPLCIHAQYVSEVWNPDNGDGTYTNPVLNADYSDPDICAVGEDYYLTASSFAHIPGLPILHSRDLVNWEIIGHALQSQFPESKAPEHGKGVWAPSIRHHNGEFYIYWGDPDRGVFMVKAKDARGPWSEPVCVIPGKGMIDTCPLWDDDGRCWLVNGWANSRCGFNSILTVRELSADGMRPISNPVIVFDGGNVNHTTEGPKFYKRDGWYWIMCPAGGVEKGWQLAMRSKSPLGPYESKTVLAQGKTAINGPHQGGWVHTPYGEDWFLHFQDKGAYGRVVWLQPVDWSSGWPIMGDKGEPLTTAEVVIDHEHQPSGERRVQCSKARPAMAVARRLRPAVRHADSRRFPQAVHLPPSLHRQSLDSAGNAVAEDSCRRVHGNNQNPAGCQGREAVRRHRCHGTQLQLACR